jgi:hypothetical protein
MHPVGQPIARTRGVANWQPSRNHQPHSPSSIYKDLVEKGTKPVSELNRAIRNIKQIAYKKQYQSLKLKFFLRPLSLRYKEQKLRRYIKLSTNL